MPMTMDAMEKEINTLHSALEKRGINSRKTTDVFGQEFELPVNAEHKATVCSMATVCSIGHPHMRVFWAATIGFFSCFFSCFAPSALGIYYKKAPPEGLGLTRAELGLAGNLAVTGTILMRVAAGTLCDMFGARKTFVGLLLLGVPGMFIFAFSQGAAAFTIGRIFIGLSLATFVTCQVWCSQFFDRTIVGKVNATAGGWGNLGGGITLLTMPFIMEFFLSISGGDINISWRLCMIVPLLLHLGSAFFIMTCRDLPDGSYAQLEAQGVKQKSKGASNVLALGFSNTNALIMLITYGLCFGVELCMNNKLVPYFTRYYGMHPTVAGPLGACFSLMNLFARAWGGILSDGVAKKYGLRGRITAMWVIQTIEGLFCILMGMVTVNSMGPDEPVYDSSPDMYPNVQGVYLDGSLEYTIPDELGLVGACASKLISSPAEAIVGGVSTTMPIPPLTRIMIRDPSPTCIHNGNSLMTTMIVMICFSICVQMAEGLHFGIVPYISRPALGVVSGMVGAGGNAGALITGQFVVGNTGKLNEGFIRLGIVIMAMSCIMHFIYFPSEGGILTPKGLPYNPQLIKEKEGQKGADELDLSKANASSTTKEMASV